MRRGFFLLCDEADGLSLQGRVLSNSKTSDLTKIYFFIVSCAKLVKKQGSIIEPTCCNCPKWMLTFCKCNPSNLCREANSATPEMRRALRVMKYVVKALYITFLGTLGTIF